VPQQDSKNVRGIKDLRKLHPVFNDRDRLAALHEAKQWNGGLR
jgi:hypothetical protein